MLNQLDIDIFIFLIHAFSSAPFLVYYLLLHTFSYRNDQNIQHYNFWTYAPRGIDSKNVVRGYYICDTQEWKITSFSQDILGQIIINGSFCDTESANDHYTHTLLLSSHCPTTAPAWSPSDEASSYWRYSREHLMCGLAQEVEQLPCNLRVASSIPSFFYLSVDASLSKTLNC